MSDYMSDYIISLQLYVPKAFLLTKFIFGNAVWQTRKAMELQLMGK